MAINKQKKQELIQLYVELLEHSQAVVFVSSRGLTVAEVTDLRSRIRETGTRYSVVKNTLFKLALTRAGMPVPDFLTGPIAIAFCGDDIAPAVKVIVDFGASMTDVEFEVVGGIVEKDIVDSGGAKALASLPTKDMLYVQILTGMNAPATQLTNMVANGIRQILNVLQARIDQFEESEAAA